MPYADKEKQRRAQREWYHRAYHAEGSTLPDYHYHYTKRRRCADVLATGPVPASRVTKAGTIKLKAQP